VRETSLAILPPAAGKGPLITLVDWLRRSTKGDAVAAIAFPVLPHEK
jgi:hypothetical protein